jgi:Mrp family chromosome partitioning ATPase
VAPPNPLELLERPAFGLLLQELVGKFDHVLVDTPAAAHGADAAVVAQRCQAALVVARRNASRVGALQDLIGSLNDATVQLAGVVVNEW